MRVLITGGGGQLAASLKHTLAGDEVLAPTRSELDITNRADVEAILAEHEPDVVVNTAAFHRVDLCESEPEASFAVNAAAVQRLAAACRQREALLVHISTDYVFGGRQSAPYREDDPIDPVNVYGCSKAAGEMAIRATWSRHLIVRTTGLYGPPGSATTRVNFVETMRRLLERGETIPVVTDQVLTPSYCPHVAEVIRRLIALGATGTYHVTNSGSCSWYDFAREIFRITGAAADLRRVKQADRPLPARRPAYSVLGHEGLRRAGIPDLPPWQEALASYLARNDAASREA